MLLTADDNVKLADFCCSTWVSENGDAHGFCGTERCMAPEMFMGLAYTKSVDWWALGVLMYEMTQVESPFNNTNGLSYKDNILKAEFHFVEPVAISKACQDVIRSLLQKEVSNRLIGLDNLLAHPFFQGASDQGE